MATAYEKAPAEINEQIAALIQEWHPDLAKVGVTIDALTAVNNSGHAVKHGGYPALATVRIISLKDRVKGLADAEIVIDADAWELLTPEQQAALLDHELYHLEPIKDGDGFKRDDIGRPKLGMKLHDVQVGWFREIATRHGANSPERIQAKKLLEKESQTFFNFTAEK